VSFATVEGEEDKRELREREEEGAEREGGRGS